MSKHPNKPKASTPLMQQYHAIKQKYPGALLLFRVGDFYETFEEDAQELHRITEVKLTKRSNGAASSVALAGFPHHALDVYLPKLVKQGLRVAICDQLETPQKGKTIVERGVTELVTPGITYHDQVLDKKQHNYLASLHFEKDKVGIAFLDISTGSFLTTEGDKVYIRKLLSRFDPAEVVFNKADKVQALAFLKKSLPHYMLEGWIYDSKHALQRLQGHFNTPSLKGFGIEDLPLAITASAAALRYLEEAEQHHLPHINRISRIEEEEHMWLDPFTMNHLELVAPQHPEGVALIQVLDHTVTAMGGRKLHHWLLMPLKKVDQIQDRLILVEVLVNHPETAHTLIQHLKQVADLERLAAKLASRRINPRELQTLKHSLAHILPIQIALKGHPVLLERLNNQLDCCEELIKLIEKRLQPHPPLVTNQGGLILPGVDDKLDHFRSLACEGNTHLNRIVAKEKERTGILSLKIGYNKVFGYYLEVTHTHKEKVPSEWIRKQTLVNAERYITEELKTYEEHILHAQEHMIQIEQQLYDRLVSDSQSFISSIQNNAKVLGKLDVLLSFAHMAKTRSYCKPIVDMSHKIEIKEGRHPVIEQCLPHGTPYVPNDTYLDLDTQQIILITGPNMAGKSAFLRQVGHIVLLSHIGCFVPATSARIGLIDKLFTRVGASDNLAKQESTFMVEMNETASILNNMSKRSLLLIDELGRGTGTSDGLALAQSILAYVHNHPTAPAKMLFATHYHQLNQLEEQLPKLKNYKVTVKEVAGQILFLHKLQKGGCQHSFGIEVAKMAGIPKEIIDAAQRVLEQIDASSHKGLLPSLSHTSASSYQLTLFDQVATSHLEEALKKLDIDQLTPIDALSKLAQWKKKLSKKG